MKIKHKCKNCSESANYFADLSEEYIHDAEYCIKQSNHYKEKSKKYANKCQCEEE